MIPQRTMRPSIARDGEQLDPAVHHADIPPSKSATLGLLPVARKLLPPLSPRKANLLLTKRGGTHTSF